MTRSIRRKITVSGKEYFWVLDGNSTTGSNGKEHHIRVHSSELTKSILYIDPLQWQFEVKPKVIAQAIEFAISKGWEPSQKAKEMYISMNGSQFYVLPKGMKFGYSDEVINGNVQ